VDTPLISGLALKNDAEFDNWLYEEDTLSGTNMTRQAGRQA
jgi:hypothetical protein